MTDSRKLRLVEWTLRYGIGLMYLYSGVDLVRHPTGWYWAVRALPDTLEGIADGIGLDIFLQGQGIFEIILALLLIAPVFPRVLVFLAALLSAAEMLFILILVGIDLTTFRDIGLFGAAVALTALLWPRPEIRGPSQHT